jgi:hypothetical protein
LFALDANGHEIVSLTPRLHLDLGAIGKGYALDTMAEVLRDSVPEPSVPAERRQQRAGVGGARGRARLADRVGAMIRPRGGWSSSIERR